jgi:heptosyltransferase III
LLEKGTYLKQTNKAELFSFDAVILQQVDTDFTTEIASLRRDGLPLYQIYSSYRFEKHGEFLKDWDYSADKNKPMVANICAFLKELFFIEHPSTQNCLSPSLDLSHRKHQKRVLIHPTSSNEKKNWLKNRFLKLEKSIEKLGFEPEFILSADERKNWPEQIQAAHFETLEDLVKTIYESHFLIGNDSGPAHIASYYQIPHIVICEGKQMPLWSPGWYPPKMIMPPKWIPNIKGLRLREKKWKYFILTNQILERFSKDCVRSEKKSSDLAF